MPKDERPNPDALLAAIKKDEARHQRGKLKIFFGMAAGVGKTYAMLEAANQKRAEGADAVVGYVETHKRAETEALLEGLEIVPRWEIEYRGATLQEMDTDAILARKPHIVLVDELAHTNVPGSRHVKRYQDAIELLEAGIDVYTTVNVQHFESRADAVRQITGITVHETVPDSVLDLADEIELIDLSPDDLRKRLYEGKVYIPDKVEVAANNFFRVGNLTALREMALRLTAEHVDHQLRDYMQLKRISGPWKSGERLMVAIGPSPFSERVIRWTRRMAYNLEAPWLAIYIKQSQALSVEETRTLARNLTLARSLGAEILTAASDNVTDELLRLARQRNVTQIIIGKPKLSRWQTLMRGGMLVSKLIWASGDIDVYVVTGDNEPGDHRSAPSLFEPARRHSSVWQYVVAVAVVAAVTALDWLVADMVNYQLIGLTELLAVLLIAVYVGRGPALLAAGVSALSWNYLFITPRFTFQVSQPQDLLLLASYFAIALFTGNLTARLRTQERQARYNADRTMALYTLAHETATAVNMDDVLRTAVAQIGRVFDAEVAILLPQEGKLAHKPHPSSTLKVDEKDFSVAVWVFAHGKPAGRFTDTLPLATAHYLPLRTPSRTVGVVGISTRQPERLSFDQEVLLETFVNQVALVIEREVLDEAAEQAAMLRESERLYTSLLNSVSHELRTPLATITDASSHLLDGQIGADDAARTLVAQDIQEAADRLSRLVENVLLMSRLDSGRLSPQLDWGDLREVIATAVKKMERCLSGRPLAVDLAPDLPLIRMDSGLIEQTLINLLSNACNYTPEGSVIRIETALEDGTLRVTVADSGQGIPSADLERVFDQFYRAPGTETGGTGLGLSICRGVVEAHGGTMTAANNPAGGAQFVIRLPTGDTPPGVGYRPITES